MCRRGVITSLFAGHGVPFSESSAAPGGSCGEQAGGNGLFDGPPTTRSSEAWCARGSGSFRPFGSPGYVGCLKANFADSPLTNTRPTFMCGPPANAEVRSKSRLKLVRHCVARSVRTTWLPGRNLLVTASYIRSTSVCTLV